VLAGEWLAIAHIAVGAQIAAGSSLTEREETCCSSVWTAVLFGPQS
jgi:hypothetical protein